MIGRATARTWGSSVIGLKACWLLSSFSERLFLLMSGLMIGQSQGPRRRAACFLCNFGVSTLGWTQQSQSGRQVDVHWIPRQL